MDLLESVAIVFCKHTFGADGDLTIGTVVLNLTIQMDLAYGALDVIFKEGRPSEVLGVRGDRFGLTLKQPTLVRGNNPWRLIASRGVHRFELFIETLVRRLVYRREGVLEWFVQHLGKSG